MSAGSRCSWILFNQRRICWNNQTTFWLINSANDYSNFHVRSSDCSREEKVTIIPSTTINIRTAHGCDNSLIKVDLNTIFAIFVFVDAELFEFSNLFFFCKYFFIYMIGFHVLSMCCSHVCYYHVDPFPFEKLVDQRNDCRINWRQKMFLLFIIERIRHFCSENRKPNKNQIKAQTSN